jgi:hypothetical protein
MRAPAFLSKHLPYLLMLPAHENYARDRHSLLRPARRRGSMPVLTGSPRLKNSRRPLLSSAATSSASAGAANGQCRGLVQLNYYGAIQIANSICTLPTGFAQGNVKNRDLDHLWSFLSAVPPHQEQTSEASCYRKDGVGDGPVALVSCRRRGFRLATRVGDFVI